MCAFSREAFFDSCFCHFDIRDVHMLARMCLRGRDNGIRQSKSKWVKLDLFNSCRSTSFSLCSSFLSFPFPLHHSQTEHTFSSTINFPSFQRSLFFSSLSIHNTRITSPHHQHTTFDSPFSNGVTNIINIISLSSMDNPTTSHTSFSYSGQTNSYCAITSQASCVV